MSGYSVHSFTTMTFTLLAGLAHWARSSRAADRAPAGGSIPSLPDPGSHAALHALHQLVHITPHCTCCTVVQHIYCIGTAHTARRTQVARTLRADAHVPASRSVRWHAQGSACQLRILPPRGEDTPARGAPATVSPHHPRQTTRHPDTALALQRQLMETFDKKVSGHPHELRVTNKDGKPSTLPGKITSALKKMYEKSEQTPNHPPPPFRPHLSALLSRAQSPSQPPSFSTSSASALTS